jgi:hypothetical protein
VRAEDCRHFKGNDVIYQNSFYAEIDTICFEIIIYVIDDTMYVPNQVFF